jgi:hypothetical protein
VTNEHTVTVLVDKTRYIFGRKTSLSSGLKPKDLNDLDWRNPKSENFPRPESLRPRIIEKNENDMTG